jgi:Mrp family chromosome partitioning ATPase
MLNIERRSHAYVYPIPRPSASSRIDLGSFARATLRYKKLLLTVVGASVVAGMFFSLLAKPVFIAEGILLIDPHRVIQPTLSVRGGAQELEALESGAVDSQVEMLKSEQLARDVITKLGLATNPDISDTGIVSTAIGALKLLIRGQPTEADIPASIVREFQNRLDIKRVRETYMISLRFKSGSPELAATTVNTLMQAHLDREGENRRNSIKAELDWMNDRLTQLRETIALVDRAVRQVSPSGGTQQDTSRLEREAESNRSVYQLLLDRYTSSLQEMSFPYAQASIVAGARAPQEKSFPNATMVLALSAIAGLFIGLGLIAYLEMGDDSFRSPQQVEATLGIPVIGLLPRPGKAAAAPSFNPNPNGRDSLAFRVGRRNVVNLPPGLSAIARTIFVPLRWLAWMRTSSALSTTRTLPVYGDVDDYRYAADKPMSRFAEGLRNVKAAFDNYSENDATGRSIGFTSALPGEGSAIVAANFAYLIAQSGKRVLLIDAETRAGTLTDRIAGNHGKYLADVIASRLTLSDATCRLDANLAFLGSGGSSQSSLSRCSADTAVIQSLIDQASLLYDYVIVNLPPMGPLADLRSFAPTLDALAVVVRWGATSQQTVRDALALPAALQGKVVGIVLNDIDFDRLASERLFGPATVTASANCLLFDD